MDYWCDHRLLVAVQQGEVQRDILVDRPYALVGSHRQANVLLSAAHSPKRAVYLHAADGAVLCRQLERAKDFPDLLDASGGLQVAGERLTVRLAEKDGSRTPRDDNARWPIPVLEVKREQSKPVIRRIHSPLQMIGRHGECEFELRCPQVSLFHCVLYLQRGRLWCIDLQSGNGTHLGGQQVACQELLVGDVLSVGSYQITFQRYSRTSSPSGGSQLRLANSGWQFLPNLGGSLVLPEPEIASQPNLPALAPAGLPQSQSIRLSPSTLPAQRVDTESESPLVTVILDQPVLTQDALEIEADPAAEINLHDTDTSSSAITASPSISKRTRIKSDPADDVLAHFVTDRLVAIDGSRRRRLVLIWTGVITVLTILGGLAIGLTCWYTAS